MAKPIVDWVAIGFGVILLSVGLFFLFFGLRLYLYPNVRGQLQAGWGIAALGSLFVILGIVLILFGVVYKGRRGKHPRKNNVVV